MDIERLTARNKNGLAYLVKVKPNEQEVDSPYKNTLKCILDCFERLAQYEEAEAKESATSEDAFPSAIKWTGKNLREVIDLTGWNESASSKWTWAEYEQVVEEKGLKIFTPNGSVMADIGDWIINNGKDYYVTTQKNKSATREEVQRAIEQLKYAREQDREFDDGTFVDSLELAITAVQQYQPKEPCVICENGDDEFVCFEDDGETIKHEAEARAVIARGEQYCRFCGRKLKGDGE